MTIVYSCVHHPAAITTRTNIDASIIVHAALHCAIVSNYSSLTTAVAAFVNHMIHQLDTVQLIIALLATWL